MIFCKTLHRWIGWIFGPVIAVICITGAILILAGWCGFDAGWAFKLHRWLFDLPAERGAMTLGKCIVGISTIAFIVILVTGVVLWSREAKVNLKKSLSLKFGKGRYVACRSLHTATGMYVLIFVAIMAITGLTWSFGWYSSAFYWIFQSDNAEATHTIVRSLHTGQIGGFVTRLIWFVSALLAFMLPITGYLLPSLRKR